MVYLKRKIDTYLKEWFLQEEKDPLIVRGARQIGKTESIRRFAEENYKSVIYINFVEEPKYKKIIDEDYSVDSIVKNITFIDNRKEFIPKDTLIFFDGIQQFPDIATSLKFFKIDGRFDVICSGSLLGIGYQSIESNSVGYKVDYDMESMDFEEFLWAKGYDENTTNDMLKHMLEKKKFSSLELERYRDMFLDYCVIGGMPRIVRSYIETGSFTNVLSMQKQIIRDYKEDIQKYAQGLDQARILNVFEYIPVQLGKENKKFQITKVAKGASFREYRGCIEWLEKAGVINICRSVKPLELPLKGNVEEDKYKIYLKDTGLLISLLDEESQMDLKLNKNFGVYKGALFENMAAEAFSKSGYELFYFKKEDSTLELDFLIREKDEIVPIEVKAKSGKAKSLKVAIENESYKEVKRGIKFGDYNIGEVNEITTFPLFTMFLLKRWSLQKRGL